MRPKLEVGLWQGRVPAAGVAVGAHKTGGSTAALPAEAVLAAHVGKARTCVTQDVCLLS